MSFSNDYNASLAGKLSDEVLTTQWMQSMLAASSDYKEGNLQQAATHSHSAIKLSLALLRSEGFVMKDEACKSYNLSVIYFLSILRQQNLLSKAKNRTDYFINLLQHSILEGDLDEDEKDACKKHLRLLQNTKQHEAFFESHLNLHIPPMNAH